MRKYDNIRRLREFAWLVYQDIPEEIRYRGERVFGRGRRLAWKIDEQAKKREPSGRAYFRRHLIGGARGLTGFLDGEGKSRKVRRRRVVVK